MSFYLKYADPNQGFSPSHSWGKFFDDFRRWYVFSGQEFCTCGFAVVDDFGNLVRVPK